MGDVGQISIDSKDSYRIVSKVFDIKKGKDFKSAAA
jgi:hypothetical protein